MTRYVTWVLKHRLWVILGCIVLTAVSLQVISTGVIASSLLKLFFGNNPKYDDYLELSSRFGRTDSIVVAFDSPKIFSREGVERLERISTRIEAIEDVASAQSFLGADRIWSEGGDLIVEPFADVARSSTSSAEVRRAREALARDPVFGGFFLSRDGRSAAVLIELTVKTDRTIESIPLLLERVVDAFKKEGVPEDTIHLAGLAPETAEATAVARHTLVQIFPVTLLLLVLVVYILFRRFWPVLITTGVALISISLTVAFAVLIDRQISLMLAMVPPVMVTVAFSDIIHLCSAYLLELQSGKEKVEAIRTSASEVGVACVFTSLTTFCGFAAFTFVPTPVFRQLGMVLGFGVAVALLLAVTLVPIFLYYVPTPRDPRVEQVRRSGAFVAWVCRVSRNTATRHPWATIAFFLFFGGLAALGALQIEVETSFAGRLRPDSRIRQAHEFIKSRFVGTNTMDIHLKLSEGSFLDPVEMERLSRFQRALRADPRVDRIISVVDLLQKLEAALDVKERDRSQGSIAQSLLLFEVSGGSDLESLVSPDRTEARLLVRLAGYGLVETANVGHRVEALGHKIFGARAEVTPTGLTYLFGDWLQYILRGQRHGLLFAFVMTSLLMIIGLRSVRVGLLAMIPNLLPILALGGFVGWAWDQVDTDTILIAIMGVGIAVDDTIHFLVRFRLESLRANGDVERAIDRTFHVTGRALVQTSIILSIGFLPFVMSAYFSTWILGSLLPPVLLVALFADLLLLPALTRIGLIRF